MGKLSLKQRWFRPPRILGSVALLAVLVLLGVWGVPFALAKWQQANYQAVHRTLRTVNDALQTYQEKFRGYPDTLERLRGGEEGNPGTAPPERARLLRTSLAKDSFTRDGYRFRYETGLADQQWAASVRLYVGYQLTAVPASSWSGELYFYTDERGAIRTAKGEIPDPADTPADEQ